MAATLSPAASAIFPIIFKAHSPLARVALDRALNGAPRSLFLKGTLHRRTGMRPLARSLPVRDDGRMSEPAGPIRYDLGFLIGEIHELERVAEQQGYSTLAYLLAVAKLEAERQARVQREDGSDLPDQDRWKPV